jgi:hypothetical protein
MVEFRWTGMSSADYYYIIVFDAATNALVWNSGTNSTSAFLDVTGFPNAINWTAAPYAGGAGGAQVCTSNYVNATR